MTPDELEERTTQFGDRILNLVDYLPRKRSANVIADQVGRSGTSVGANYRAARRARSKKEFCAKLCIVVEEASETQCWLDLIERRNLVSGNRLSELRRESEEPVKVFAKMRKTAFGG